MASGPPLLPAVSSPKQPAPRDKARTKASLGAKDSHDPQGKAGD
jgi:hypothetical protein